MVFVSEPGLYALIFGSRKPEAKYIKRWLPSRLSFIDPKHFATSHTCRDRGAACSSAIIDENGKPWWVAKEICDILELGNVTWALKSLDDGEKMEFRITKFQTRGRGGDSGKRILINEPGLYGLIFRSRKPEARKSSDKSPIRHHENENEN